MQAKKTKWLMTLFLILIIFIPSVSSAEGVTSAEEVRTTEQSNKIDKKANSVTTDDLTIQASAGIATLTIFADPTASTIGSSGLSYDLGTHAFITTKNILHQT